MSYAAAVSQPTTSHARPPAGLLRRTSPLIAAGLVLVVLGTFLPWLRSGSVERNSYATGGALHDLIGGGGASGLALDAWPFVSLACAVATALLVLGLSRAGALLGALAGLAAGAVATIALTVRSGFTVAPARLGPAVTLAGAVITLLAAVPVIILGRTR